MKTSDRNLAVEISKHFTQKGARKVAHDFNTHKPRGRSSGWKKFDYGVRRSGDFFRRWEVYVRSSN